MKAVIICIDRDNDLGSKGKVDSPVIGREENVRAALALGLADPEDADTNTVLAAIKLYDQMVKEGENVEVVTICGDVDVGVKSDRILMRQLDEVIEVVSPKTAILVSNGAEDEYIFQMISSRLKIDHVHDVYVKQSRQLENWYYYIAKVAREPKLRLKAVVPISMVFILMGLFYLYPVFQYLAGQGNTLGKITDYALPTLSILIGIYILWRAYMVGDMIVAGARKTKESIYAGNLSLIFVIAALLLIITGVVNGVNAASTTDPSISSDWFTRSILFLASAIPWFSAGAIVLEARKAANAIVLRDSIPNNFWSVVTALFGVSMLALAAAHYLEGPIVLKLPRAPSNELILAETVIGFIVLLVGYIQERRGKVDPTVVRDRWRK